MKITPLRILLLWLLAMGAGVAIVWHSRFVADMSFFLPSRPSAEQQVLVEQMQDGAVSRLLMLAIEGGDEAARAQASKALRRALMGGGNFQSVQNGEMAALDAERDFLLRWRYVLSPAVTPEHFTEAGLRQAIGRSIDLISSPIGQRLKPYLLQDPTGEVLEVLTQLQPGSEPRLAGGVWASADGRRALLLAQTRAAGSDTDGQEQAITQAQALFAALPQARGLQLVLSGPGMFAVQSRETVRSEVSRTSTLGMLGIALVLAWVYRSPRTLALGLLPVATAALAGIVCVSLVFGNVHGITIGFGSALIGEAVDYAIYFCIQSGRVGLAQWRAHFWPTIRLGVLTSALGFGALLFAGFPGLAQLGLYALSGVLTAALMTRFVLPRLAGARGVAVSPPGVIARSTQGWLAQAQRLRWPLLLLALLAMGYLLAQRGQLWSNDLSALSMVRAQDAQKDAHLRGDLGAPDARYLVLVRAPQLQAVLQGAEQAGERLQRLVQQGLIGGFDSPARFVPSERTQAARLAALPAAEPLRAALAPALDGLPLSPARLAPFVDAVEAARHQPWLLPQDLDGTALALALHSLLAHGPQGWSAMLPLRPAQPGNGEGDGADIPVPALRAALAGTPAVVMDLKGEFEQMYGDYLRQAIWLSLCGVAAIALLLAAQLRSPRRLARVLLTLAITVALVVAGLHLLGVRLHLLHLVGLLLIVAVGSNYALFFDQVQADGGLPPDVWLSMATAVLTTAIGFGALALSGVPVLQALGSTVAPGVLLAMLVSAALIPPTPRTA
ncbi:MAG: MMPL family transporter [Proteobacteria bacterium]|nr:MMPL family transporter [Pseudomonadota bacterium]